MRGVQAFYYFYCGSATCGVGAAERVGIVELGFRWARGAPAFQEDDLRAPKPFAYIPKSYRLSMSIYAIDLNQVFIYATDLNQVSIYATGLNQMLVISFLVYLCDCAAGSTVPDLEELQLSKNMISALPDLSRTSRTLAGLL